MTLYDLVHYIAERAIPPDYFGFSSTLIQAKDYSLIPQFAFLSGQVQFVQREHNNPYMKVLR